MSQRSVVTGINFMNFTAMLSRLAVLYLVYYVLCEASEPSIAQSVADLMGRL